MAIPTHRWQGTAAWSGETAIDSVLAFLRDQQPGKIASASNPGYAAQPFSEKEE
jgi:hypothetical protein